MRRLVGVRLALRVEVRLKVRAWLRLRVEVGVRVRVWLRLRVEVGVRVRFRPRRPSRGASGGSCAA